MSSLLNHWSVLVSCEHATNAVPKELNLGLEQEILDSHIAWDPGALDVARAVAKQFDAPLYEGEWSRVVADLNRRPDNPEVVPEISFGIPVPGNIGLSEEQLKERIDTYHRPYRLAVFEAIHDELEKHQDRPLIHLSVHSFTGDFDGETRPMSLSIMCDPDRAIERYVADIWHESISSCGYVSAENDPYDGRWDALAQACRSRFDVPRYAPIELELSHKHLDEIERVISCTLECMKAMDREPYRT